jgi:hypothetical protein
MEEMIVRILTAFLVLTLLSGCAQHRIVVKKPNPTGQPVTVYSTAYAFGTVQPVTAAECNTNLLSEVRVHQNLGRSLASVLTLGIVNPIKIEYVCAKDPNPPVTDGD